MFIFVDELKQIGINKKVMAFALFCLMGFSILSTKNYFNYNRIKWLAVNYLKNENNTLDKDINAGYEHAGWCSDDGVSWYNKWKNDPANKFVISKGPLSHYNTLTYFVYQRYLPFRNDTVFILKQKVLLQNKY